MNKNQYLAELKSYLGYLPLSEREIIVNGYAKRFNEASEMDCAAMMFALGSPMSLAINIKRRMNQGEDVFKEFTEPAKKHIALEAAEDEPQEEAEISETEEEVEEVKAAAEVAQEIKEEKEEESVALAKASSQEIEKSTKEPLKDEKIISGSGSFVGGEGENLSEDDEIASMLLNSKMATEGCKKVKKSKKQELTEKNASNEDMSAGGKVVSIIGKCILIVIAWAFFGLFAFLGGLFFMSSMEFISVAFSAIGTKEYFMILMGAGLLLFCLALFIFWSSIWACLRVINLCFKFDAMPRVLSAIWKIVLLSTAILSLIAVILVGLAVFMGADVNALAESEIATKALNSLMPENLFKPVLDILPLK